MPGEQAGNHASTYLGKPVSVVSRFLEAALMMLALLAFYVGVSTTVGDELPVSPILIAALMFSAALVFVVLAMGIASILYSIGLRNMMHELLPGKGVSSRGVTG